MHLAMMSAQDACVCFLIQSIEMKLLGIAGLKTKIEKKKKKSTYKAKSGTFHMVHLSANVN